MRSYALAGRRDPGRATPTARSSSKGYEGRPSRCEPSASSVPSPTRPPASCCREDRDQRRGEARPRRDPHRGHQRHPDRRVLRGEVPRPRAERAVVARLRDTNGVVTAEALTGQVIATSTNGGIVARSLAGRLEARITNGACDIALAAVGAERCQPPDDERAGRPALPATAKADLSAACRNGAITVDGPEARAVRRAVAPPVRRQAERRRRADRRGDDQRRGSHSRAQPPRDRERKPP